jgi:hypothetical protein
VVVSLPASNHSPALPGFWGWAANAGAICRRSPLGLWDARNQVRDRMRMQLRNVSKRRGRLVGLAVAVLAAGVLVVVAPGSQAVATAAVPVVPAVARNADGRLELFAVDADCHIRYRWQLTAGSTSWSPWKVFGGCVSSIAAATNGLGGIEVFGSENAGKVFHRWQLAPNADSWSTWVDFAPAGTLSAPASLTMASGPPGPGPLVVLGADSAGAYDWEHRVPCYRWCR